MLPQSNAPILGLTLTPGQRPEVPLDGPLERILADRLRRLHRNRSAHLGKSQAKQRLSHVHPSDALPILGLIVENHPTFGVILSRFTPHRKERNRPVHDDGLEPGVTVGVNVDAGYLHREGLAGPEEQIQRGLVADDQQRAGLDRRLNLADASVLGNLLADKVPRDVRRFGEAGYLGMTKTFN